MAPVYPIDLDIDFAALMALESHGPDVYVGISPDYPWGRVYGGQVVAQGLRAAAATVDEDRHVHSLHAYFIRGGTSSEPIRYEVDRIRNGRSFTTRRVVARQSEGAILNLSCSFQVVEDQVDVQESMAPGDMGSAEDGANEDWGMLGHRRAIQEPGHSASWLRILSDLGNDRVLHDCALAFLSDDLPSNASVSSHPQVVDMGMDREERHQSFMGASLDHAIWFHRHAPADQWQLHDFRSHGLTGGRGLSSGEVFSLDGIHVASVAQEFLFRELTR